MDRVRSIGRPVALILALTLGIEIVPSGVARAALVGTAELVEAAPSPDAERAELAALFARADVRRELLALGVDPDEAAARVAALSDAEVARIAGELEKLPAGGVVGALITAGLIIFLVLLVTDLLGLTDVYSFVK